MTILDSGLLFGPPCRSAKVRQPKTDILTKRFTPPTGEARQKTEYGWKENSKEWSGKRNRREREKSPFPEIIM